MIDPARDYAIEPMTRVTFVLQPFGEETRLTISEVGFDRLPPDRGDMARQANDGGWVHQARLIARYRTMDRVGRGAMIDRPGDASARTDAAALFGVLDDPQRLDIVDRLRDGGPFATAPLVDPAWRMLWQGQTKHLRVAEASGPIDSVRIGRIGSGRSGGRSGAIASGCCAPVSSASHVSGTPG